jgi:hypothetical protein
MISRETSCFSRQFVKIASPKAKCEVCKIESQHRSLNCLPFLGMNETNKYWSGPDSKIPQGKGNSSALRMAIDSPRTNTVNDFEAG